MFRSLSRFDDIVKSLKYLLILIGPWLPPQLPIFGASMPNMMIVCEAIWQSTSIEDERARYQTPKPSFYGGTSASDRFTLPLFFPLLSHHCTGFRCLAFCSPMPINTSIKTPFPVACPKVNALTLLCLSGRGIKSCKC